MTWLINLRKGVKEDEKNSKIMSVFLAFLLVVGCGTSKSVTQQLAGEYESIILEEPKSSDGTSGNASYDLHDSSHNVYYGTYKVYEKI